MACHFSRLSSRSSLQSVTADFQTRDPSVSRRDRRPLKYARYRLQSRFTVATHEADGRKRVEKGD